MDNEILNRVFDPEPEAGDAEMDVAGANPPAGAPAKGGSEPDAGNLQSKLDTATAENLKLQERLAALESVAPLARYVDQNPQVLDHLDALTRLDVGAINRDGEAEPLPEYPEKPKDFDPQDVSDPNTPSGQYWIGLQEYNAKAAARLLAESGRQSEESKARVQAIESSRRERALKEEITTRLVGQYGLETEQVTDFWNFITDPKNMNEANMVRFYKANKGIPGPSSENGKTPPQEPEKPQLTPEQQALAKQAERLGLRLTLPETVAIGPGADAGGGATTDGDLFFGSLVDKTTDTGLIF